MTHSAEPSLDIPPAWERIDFESLQGVLLVVGAVDTGKSTFARFLFQRLNGPAHSQNGRAAYLDSDPGQSSLGPPATQTLALGRPGEVDFPPRGGRWRSFVGSTSPAGHLLPTLVGAARLVEKARSEGAARIVVDTSGMIAASPGGMALKMAKFDLLHPAVVFALQRREQELEPLITPLQRSRRARVLRLPVSAGASKRSTGRRKEHRRAQFARYFSGARECELAWDRVAVFPAPAWRLHRLVALEDARGFTLGLGIVTGLKPKTQEVSLRTPLRSLETVNALRLGDLTVDPQTFEDQQIR